MKLEKFKANNMRKIVIGVLLFVGIASAIFLNTSRAKYRTTQSIPIYRGIINYKPYDFKMMAMYQANDSGEYTEIETMPSSGYVINEEKSYCYTTSSSEIDTNAKLYTDEKGQHVFANLSKNSKCYLYFDEYANSYIARDTILANKTVNERTDFSAVVATTSTNTVYKAQDDDGESYYFAGAVTDNYVKFGKWASNTPDVYLGYYSATISSYKEYSSLSACQSASSYNTNCTLIRGANKDMYWRIIRINGDGTIRLIYDGIDARISGKESDGAVIGRSAFNTNYNDNMYVGYMYTSGSVHGLGTNSTIKSVLDTWYKNNLVSYENYIDENAGFCGDRNSYTNTLGTTSGGGTGTTNTYYGGHVRLVTNKAPSLKCSDNSDLYTVSGSSKGNKALSYPIGLITSDEVAYAGGVYQTANQSYYLYSGQYYWTMSPDNFLSSNAGVFLVVSDGSLGNVMTLSYTESVRPVINLRADIKFKAGSLGTMESPYIVEGAE